MTTIACILLVYDSLIEHTVEFRLLESVTGQARVTEVHMIRAY